MKYLKTGLPLLFLIISLHSFSQIGFVAYPFNKAAGLRFNTTKISTELRLSFDYSSAAAANIFLIEPSATIYLPVYKKESVAFQSGLGCNYGLHTENKNYWSVFVPFAIDFSPFEKLTNLHFIVETDLGRKQYSGFSNYSLSGLFGVCLYFKKQ